MAKDSPELFDIDKYVGVGGACLARVRYGGNEDSNCSNGPACVPGHQVPVGLSCQPVQVCSLSSESESDEKTGRENDWDLALATSKLGLDYNMEMFFTQAFFEEKGAQALRCCYFYNPLLEIFRQTEWKFLLPEIIHLKNIFSKVL